MYLKKSGLKLVADSGGNKKSIDLRIFFRLGHVKNQKEQNCQMLLAKSKVGFRHRWLLSFMINGHISLGVSFVQPLKVQ